MALKHIVPLMMDRPPTTLQWSDGSAPSAACDLTPLTSMKFNSIAFGTETFAGVNTQDKLVVGYATIANYFEFPCPPAAIDTGNNYLQVLTPPGQPATFRALRSDGTMVVTGFDYYGSFGIGSVTSPLYITTLTAVAGTWSMISAGTQSGMTGAAISTTAKLYTCGYNFYGQLGQGDTTNRNTYTQVGSDDWLHIAAGDFHMVGIKSDGTAWAWGLNDYGQLGVGDLSNRSSPTQIGVETNWTRAAVGPQCSALINSLGELYVFGRNTDGQLGLGDTTNRTTPALLLASGARSVHFSGLYGSIFVLKTDGTAWAAGISYGTELFSVNPGPTLVQVAAGPYLRAAIGYENSVLLKVNA